MKIISKRGRKPKLNVVQLCQADPMYFINNYVRVQDAKRLIPFKLYPYQEEYVRFLMNNPLVVAVMPRQVGTTTSSIAFMLWDAIFHRDRLLIIGGKAHYQSTHLMCMVTSMLNSLPQWLQPQVTRSTSNTLQFGNGSKLIVGVTSSNLVLGQAPNRVYLDSFACSSPEVQADVFLMLVAFMAQGGGAIFASTPNGVGDTFAQLYNDAMNGRPPALSLFKRTVNDLPQFDSHWKKTMKAAIGSSTWARDFECEFA